MQIRTQVILNRLHIGHEVWLCCLCKDCYSYRQAYRQAFEHLILNLSLIL